MHPLLQLRYCYLCRCFSFTWLCVKCLTIRERWHAPDIVPIIPLGCAGRAGSRPVRTWRFVFRRGGAWSPSYAWAWSSSAYERHFFNVWWQWPSDWIESFFVLHSRDHVARFGNLQKQLAQSKWVHSMIHNFSKGKTKQVWKQSMFAPISILGLAIILCVLESYAIRKHVLFWFFECY